MGRVAIPTLICMVVAYFVCGVPFGLLITKALGIDVRKVGSGNIGTTNVARAAGPAASAVTLALDAAKGFVSVMLARHLIPALAGIEPTAIETDQPLGCCLTLVFLACIIGHVFSPYLKFRGGKGIAVGLGAALGISVPFGLCLLAGFIAVVVPTKYVSAGSCFAALSLPVWSLIYGFSWQAVLPTLLIAALVLWAHRSNIGRLMRHEEKKFSFKKPEQK